jgi:RNA polymerase sigma factor (sigma-70 family)
MMPTTTSEKAQRWLIFAGHARMVRSYIRHLVSDPQEAEDLFQEVSLTVWCHQTGPRDLEKFGPWCRGLVRNAAFELRRKRRGERQHVALELEQVDDGVEYEQLLGLDDDVETVIGCRQLLARSMGRASRDSQLLLVRRYVFEETAADIALEQGNSAVAVRMKLKRARDRVAGSAR